MYTRGNDTGLRLRRMHGFAAATGARTDEEFERDVHLDGLFGLSESVVQTLAKVVPIDERREIPESGWSFDDFYLEHFGRLVVIAAAVAGERSGAEDVAQDAMLDAHRRWNRIAHYESPYAWVRRVAVQRALKVRRRRAVADRAAVHLVERNLATTMPERDDDLWAALAGLSPQQRAAVGLHHLEGLSLKEIGDVLGCAPGTVKAHLHRGRTAMAAALTNLTSENETTKDAS